jgi:prevent-host-death family protein
MMRTYDIHEAKAQLSRLVERAARGESFVIAKAAKPVVKVTALDAPETSNRKRFGFMAGQIKAPADFNTMGAKKIHKLFESKK